MDVKPLPLPNDIKSRYVSTESGLTQHILETGDRSSPLIMLMHGFPEIAFSWRYLMPALADAGFWVVAPDHRGFGRTSGWEDGYDCDLNSFSMINLVRDNLALIRALDREYAHAIIGHDFGSSLTAWTALMRPDIVKRIVLMSAPFSGPPQIVQHRDSIYADLLALDRPRKHYKEYYSERFANEQLIGAPQGLHDFLRAYFHMKSADWAPNAPQLLKSWTAKELAKMPTYYVMNASETMAETVAHAMPQKVEIEKCKWMPNSDLTVYAAEFSRTGMQGGLNWYRCSISSIFQRELSVFHDFSIKKPAMFIAGNKDWGWAQAPGALDTMEKKVCSNYYGTFLIEGAGHWVQQEKPVEVIRLLLKFLEST